MFGKFKKKLKMAIMGIFCTVFKKSRMRPAVLMFHSISEKNHFLSVKPDVFEDLILFFKKQGFYFINFSDLIEEKKLPDKSVLFTFDDGYEDNFSIARPILEKYNVPAVFFVSSGLVGGENEGLKMMSSDQIGILAKIGIFEIGGHGLFHKRLTRLSEEELIKEIGQDKLNLEKMTNKKISAFSYAFGRFGQREKDWLVKFDYKLAFTIEPYRLFDFEKMAVPRIAFDESILTPDFFSEIFRSGFENFWKLRRIFKKQ